MTDTSTLPALALPQLTPDQEALLRHLIDRTPIGPRGFGPRVYTALTDLGFIGRTEHAPHDYYADRLGRSWAEAVDARGSEGYGTRVKGFCVTMGSPVTGWLLRQLPHVKYSGNTARWLIYGDTGHTYITAHLEEIYPPGSRVHAEAWAAWRPDHNTMDPDTYQQRVTISTHAMRYASAVHTRAEGTEAWYAAAMAYVKAWCVEHGRPTASCPHTTGAWVTYNDGTTKLGRVWVLLRGQEATPVEHGREYTGGNNGAIDSFVIDPGAEIYPDPVSFHPRTLFVRWTGPDVDGWTGGALRPSELDSGWHPLDD